VAHQAELDYKHKTQGDLEELSLKVDSLEARVNVIEGRLKTLSETSPLNEGAGSMAGRPVAADKASRSQGETNSGDTHEQAAGLHLTQSIQSRKGYEACGVQTT